MTIDKIQGTFDWASVVKHFQALGGGLREIRLVRSKGGTKIDRYFVDSVDSLNNIQPILQNLNHEGYEVYCSLNPLVDSVRQKAHDKCGSDEDVVSRAWVLIDIDRAEGTTKRAASGQELEQANAIMTTIVDELVGKFPDLEPIVVGTGNGMAIWVPTELENLDAASDQVGRLLGAIDRRFCEGTAFKVDQSVKNASRVARLAGTINCKFEPRQAQLLLSGGRRFVLDSTGLESLIKRLDQNALVAQEEVQELDSESQVEPMEDDFDAEDYDQPAVANEDEKRITAYFNKRLVKFRSTPSGKKHSERLRLSFRMGQLAAGHEVGYMRDEIITRMFDELPPKENEAKELKAIEDGWSEGYAKPERLPDKPSYSYNGRIYYDPQVIATKFLEKQSQPIRVISGTPYAYADGCYAKVEEQDFDARLVNFCNDHFHRHHQAEIDYRRAREGARVKDVFVRPAKITDVRNARLSINGICNVQGLKTMPGWADRAPGDWPVSEIVVCPNGLLNIKSLQQVPLTIRFASLGKSMARWEGKDAKCPVFDDWLMQVLPGDDEESNKQRENLLMYAGLSLVPDRTHHKILQLLGIRRSGKGTFLRLLRKIVGPHLVATTTGSDLSGDFGLEPLLGRILTIVPDFRPGRKVDLNVGAERLLSISGGDFLSVNRKHLPIIPDVDMPVRFIFAANGHMDMPDPHGVLPTRLITVNFRNCFAGREEPGIELKFEKELPGILAKFVRHYHLLQRLGRFHETNSSSDACEIMLGMGQPLHNFVSEVFDQYGNARLDLDDAFSAYVGWHERNSPGTRPMAKGKFKAEIQTINLGVKVVRSRVGDRRDEVLVGLKPTADFEDLLSAGRAERGLQDYQTQSF